MRSKWANFLLLSQLSIIHSLEDTHTHAHMFFCLYVITIRNFGYTYYHVDHKLLFPLHAMPCMLARYKAKLTQEARLYNQIKIQKMEGGEFQ